MQPVFDAHLHIIDARFPLIPNNGFLPDTFLASHYRARTGHLGVVGGAVVSGSFQGFDQSHLLDALKTLGAGFVGVTQLPEEVGDDRIHELHAAGVRALRFNLYRGGSAGADALEALAQRVWTLCGWHTEVYADGETLGRLRSLLLGLPALCIDHLGLTRTGFEHCLELAAAGARVKACGFGRLDFDPATALRELCAVSIRAPMFGTDLPSTRAPQPFTDADLALVRSSLDDTQARAVLHDNAVNFYRVERPADGSGQER